MAKPQLITFTGADDRTTRDDVNQMIDLSKQFPVEFAFLISESREGTSRYPSPDARSRIMVPLASAGVQLAIHVCGRLSREILVGSLAVHIPPVVFDRVQINTADLLTDERIEEAFTWADARAARAILQWRNADTFPSGDDRVSWLFDRSGGRGELPGTWPTSPTRELVGYAGGLNPGNVAAQVNVISGLAANCWIDMETGVRNADDLFDVNLCRQVCEAVYG